ncbi:MAG: hypothetical protein GW939_01510 [Candidatus Magasanikbacteria bacterium]|nr:hypothetical protein [Candidatus Magasanikbacteria bacterium]NCS71984.1 hypothetical protein [Candidatus Magasanikbacteria bacterium]
MAETTKQGIPAAEPTGIFATPPEPHGNNSTGTVDLDALKKRLGLDRVLNRDVQSSVGETTKDDVPQAEVFDDSIDFLAGFTKLDIQDDFLIQQGKNGIPMWFPLTNPIKSGLIGSIYRLDGGKILKRMVKPLGATEEQFLGMVKAEYNTLRLTQDIPHAASIEAAGMVLLPNGETEYYIQMPDGGESVFDYQIVGTRFSALIQTLRLQYPEHEWLFQSLDQLVEAQIAVQNKIEKMKAHYLGLVPNDVAIVEKSFTNLVEQYSEQLLLAKQLFYQHVGELMTPAIEGTHAMHAAGLVHGDIKPENYTVGYHDKDGKHEGMVIDFGTVTREGDPLPDFMNGTPAYLDPALLLRSVDLRKTFHRSSDYYAMIRTEFNVFLQIMELPPLPDLLSMQDAFFAKTGQYPNGNESIALQDAMFDTLKKTDLLSPSFFRLQYIGNANGSVGDIYDYRLSEEEYAALMVIERDRDVSSAEGIARYKQDHSILWKRSYDVARQELHKSLLSLDVEDMKKLKRVMKYITDPQYYESLALALFDQR